MAGLYIEKVRDAERQRTPLFEALDQMLNHTRRRAFELFQQRGAPPAPRWMTGCALSGRCYGVRRLN
jgi:hypothetical protein